MYIFLWHLKRSCTKPIGQCRYIYRSIYSRSKEEMWEQLNFRQSLRLDSSTDEGISKILCDKLDLSHIFHCKLHELPRAPRSRKSYVLVLPIEWSGRLGNARACMFHPVPVCWLLNRCYLSKSQTLVPISLQSHRYPHRIGAALAYYFFFFFLNAYFKLSKRRAKERCLRPWRNHDLFEEMNLAHALNSFGSRLYKRCNLTRVLISCLILVPLYNEFLVYTLQSWLWSSVQLHR